MLPESTLPAQLEQEPARQEYGNSKPSSSAWSKMYTSSGQSKDCVPSGVSRVTLKWAGTPGRAGTVFTMAGTSPAASALPDKALHPKCTLCWGATKVNSASLEPQKFRTSATQQATANKPGSTRDWDAMMPKVDLCLISVHNPDSSHNIDCVKLQRRSFLCLHAHAVSNLSSIKPANPYSYSYFLRHLVLSDSRSRKR